MTGITESRRLEYGEEVDSDMLSIATTDIKVIPDTKAKPLLLILQFTRLLAEDNNLDFVE